MSKSDFLATLVYLHKLANLKQTDVCFINCNMRSLLGYYDSFGRPAIDYRTRGTYFGGTRVVLNHGIKEIFPGFGDY